MNNLSYTLYILTERRVPRFSLIKPKETLKSKTLNIFITFFQERAAVMLLLLVLTVVSVPFFDTSFVVELP